jgi:hypothetical protein
VTNTLAYYITYSVTALKGFIIKGPYIHNFIFCITYKRGKKLQCSSLASLFSLVLSNTPAYWASV